MRYVFVSIVLIHGLIHLMGFVRAYFLTEVNKQVLGISEPMGAVWLVIAILFIAISASYLKNGKWFYLALFAIFISQLLIIASWRDTKFGTILNVIILLVAISAFANDQFHKMVQKESKRMFQQVSTKNILIITESDIIHLPDIIQKWVHNSGMIGKEKIVSVRLKQKGTMRTKPQSKWMSFEAIQYFNLEDPSFVWFSKVNSKSLIHMVGRDKLKNGEGEMLIKLVSLIPVVNEGNNKQINSGTMIRFLSEICWFPSAALNDYIHWESIDATSAKAIFTYKSISVSGIFKFNQKGNLVSFEANRYFGGGEDAVLQKWFIHIIDYKTFEGITIPNKCEVSWLLPKGNFNWLHLEVVDVEYNNTSLYERNI